MASGTINLTKSKSSGSYIEGKIVWSATADNSTNTSKNVTANLYVRKGNTDMALTVPTEGTWSYSLTVNGSNVSGSVHKSVLTDWVLIATKKISSIAHGADGKKSITISGSVTAPTGTSFEGHTTSGSKSVSLDTIPRASSITSASNVTLGNKCSVKWTPASASFRYKLKFSIGGWSHTTGAIHPNKTTAYTYTGYTVPLEAANQIPDTRTGKMTVTLYTYSNADATTQVGSADSETFTITVPDNSSTKPVVSMTLSPVSSLPSNFAGLYIQGLTKVKATLSAEGKYGASIDSYLMKVDGVFYDEDDALTSGHLATAGSRTVYGYATDGRGHIGENRQTITVIAYSAPRLENASAFRCDKNGNASDSGTYLKIKAKRSYSPVVSNGVQKNFCNIMYRYSDGLSYTAWSTILDGSSLGSNEVTTGALLSGGLSAQASYTVQLRAIDDVGRYADTYITIPTDKVYMHRDGARNALGLGKYNERDDAVDSEWDVYMNGHKVTGLPAPTSGSDAVPRSYVDPADVKMEKNLSAQGWYKIGTVSGEMCGVVTLTIGGVFVNNQASPSMVDIATQHNNARAFLRLPALTDNQISKIGVIKESSLVYGVYGYYNSANANTVKINIHTHMGAFAQDAWTASSVSESSMLAVVTLKE